MCLHIRLGQKKRKKKFNNKIQIQTNWENRRFVLFSDDLCVNPFWLADKTHSWKNTPKHTLNWIRWVFDVYIWLFVQRGMVSECANQTRTGFFFLLACLLMYIIYLYVYIYNKISGISYSLSLPAIRSSVAIDWMLRDTLDSLATDIYLSVSCTLSSFWPFSVALVCCVFFLVVGRTYRARGMPSSMCSCVFVKWFCVCVCKEFVFVYG